MTSQLDHYPNISNIPERFALRPNKLDPASANIYHQQSNPPKTHRWPSILVLLPTTPKYSLNQIYYSQPSRRHSIKNCHIHPPQLSNLWLRHLWCRHLNHFQRHLFRARWSSYHLRTSLRPPRIIQSNISTLRNSRAVRYHFDYVQIITKSQIVGTVYEIIVSIDRSSTSTRPSIFDESFQNSRSHVENPTRRKCSSYEPSPTKINACTFQSFLFGAILPVANSRKWTKVFAGRSSSIPITMPFQSGEEPKGIGVTESLGQLTSRIFLLSPIMPNLPFDRSVIVPRSWYPGFVY